MKSSKSSVILPGHRIQKVEGFSPWQWWLWKHSKICFSWIWDQKIIFGKNPQLVWKTMAFAIRTPIFKLKCWVEHQIIFLKVKLPKFQSKKHFYTHSQQNKSLIRWLNINLSFLYKHYRQEVKICRYTFLSSIYTKHHAYH